MLFDIAFYIGFVMVVCFFIVRWRENQFNLEKNEHNVGKLTEILVTNWNVSTF